MVNIEKISIGKLKQNCYIIYKNKHCFIIDPGGDSDRIIDFIESKKLKVFAILNTHGHYDHIGAVQELKDKFKIPFLLCSKDKKLLKHANLYFIFSPNAKFISIPKVDYYFDEIELADFPIGVLFTPGHTSGGVCFQAENYLFTGDTLLKGELAPIDKIEGNKFELIESLKKIAGLPLGTIIHPGHSKSTILSDELKHNKEFIKMMEEKL